MHSGGGTGRTAAGAVPQAGRRRESEAAGQAELRRQAGVVADVSEAGVLAYCAAAGVMVDASDLPGVSVARVRACARAAAAELVPLGASGGTRRGRKRRERDDSGLHASDMFF